MRAEVTTTRKKDFGVCGQYSMVASFRNPTCATNVASPHSDDTGSEVVSALEWVLLSVVVRGGMQGR